MGAKGKSKYSGQFMEGQQFSKWTVVSPEIVMQGEAKIQCRCDCGTTRLVSVFTLINGTSTSCYQCSHSKPGKLNKGWKGYDVIPSNFISKLSNSNDSEKLLEMWRKQEGKCAITSWPISFDDRSASLDRIDSTKGYDIDNIHWVHVNVNICKNGFSLEYFITLCHAVAINNINPEQNFSNWKFGNKISKGK